MSRWDNNAEEPNIEFVARFGDSILYRDLPNQLKTDAVADFFGAVSDAVLEGGVVVCGSIGEGELFLFWTLLPPENDLILILDPLVSNDPLYDEVFEGEVLPDLRGIANVA